MQQLTFDDPLSYSLRTAWEKYHRQPDHSDRYKQDVKSCLSHWERCTRNPPIVEITNVVMQDFRNAFLSRPLPSKVEQLCRRCAKANPAAKQLLSSLKLNWLMLHPLDAEQRQAKLDKRFEELNELGSIPEEAQLLLPSKPRFNNVRATLEAILAKLGPPSPGNRFAVGLLPSVPCCQPAEEEDPDVVIATADQVSAIYQHCEGATWPHAQDTGVPAAEVWKALTVYVYNLAPRKDDFLTIAKTQVKLKAGLMMKRQGKSGKFRPMPLNQLVVQHLQSIWHSTGELLFPFPNNNRDLYAQWYRIQQSAGIQVDRAHGSRRKPYFGFHEIRKTSLTEYYDLDERAAQQMGCHSDMATTLKHYIAASRKEGVLRRASEAMPQPSAFLTESNPLPPPRGDRPQLKVWAG